MTSGDHNDEKAPTMTDPALDFRNWPLALACLYGPYRARVLSVTDGDTFKALVDVGLRAYVRAVIRLHGIDAPERDARGGAAATVALGGILTPGRPIRVTTFGYDSFGRWLCRVEIVAEDGVQSVADMMVEQGHALARHYG